MQPPSIDPPRSRPEPGDLARAEGRGRQVLLYAPQGPLGGSFACLRCGACALQPDLLDHRAECPYRSPLPATMDEGGPARPGTGGR